MNRRAQLGALAISGVAPVVAAFTALRRLDIVISLLVAVVVAYLGYRWVLYVVPLLTPRHLKAGLFGKDINKRGTEAGEKPVPEALGLAPGVVTLVCLALVHMLHTVRFVPRLCERLGITQLERSADQWDDDFPAALASIAFMLMLGFVDDVLDLPWRVKLVMPVVASLPLLAAYSGATAVGIPKPIVNAFSLTSTYIELGPLYYVYMVMLVIFCTNAINILAGVNGLEAGQSYLVSAAILTHNILQLSRAPDDASQSAALLSAYIIIPLMSTSLALLAFNWYPSQVFVGDTYTYFAGMSIAVAGILGHFSETLLIFLIPQVFNFVYSIPQLFGLVHCPRHRLPTFHPGSGLLTATKNWNVVNLVLQVAGSCTELALCIRILAVQWWTCLLGICLHWALRGTWK